MLDSLLEMEIAYSLMKSSGTASVDNYYNQLNAEIDILHRESEEFKIIHEYVKNTHAATHASYQLDVEDVSICFEIYLNSEMFGKVLRYIFNK